MAHHHGNHDPQTDLANAKRAMLDVAGEEFNAPSHGVGQRVQGVHGVSELVRSHPIATLAGAATLGVIVVTQPWLRRLVTKLARTAALAAVARATTK